MGKIKKTGGMNGVSPKEKVQKRHSLLTTTEKSNSPKNRRKSIGTALSTPFKQFKAEKIPKSTGKVAKSTGKVAKSIDNVKSPEARKLTSKSTPKPQKTAKNTSPEEDLQKIIDIDELKLNVATIKSGIKALLKLVADKKNDKELFKEASPILLQISTVKIASCPVRTLRLPLTHPLVDDSSEICLIVADIPGNLKKNHDNAVEHYEGILKQHGVTNVKKIMPYHELKTEHDQYELKRKLVELYDAFLVEGKISGYVVKHCGKIFQQKRKLPIPVKLHVSKLRKHISSALSKTPMHIHPHGDNFVVQFARTNMDEEEIFDNIVSICLGLKRDFPGGWTNVKGLNIKAAQSMSVPIYYTLKNPSDMEVPIVQSKRPKAFKEVKGELSTILGAQVTVLPTGDVILDKQHDSAEDDSDDDLLRKVQTPKSNAKKRKASVKKRNISVTTDESFIEENDSEDTKSDVKEPSPKARRKYKTTLNKGPTLAASDKSAQSIISPENKNLFTKSKVVEKKGGQKGTNLKKNKARKSIGMK